LQQQTGLLFWPTLYTCVSINDEPNALIALRHARRSVGWWRLFSDHSRCGN